jgi:hypothetical protein
MDTLKLPHRSLSILGIHYILYQSPHAQCAGTSLPSFRINGADDSRLTSNYQPVSRATPITQLEFYQHYHASIPPVGYPPLMDGKGFIMLAARHFAGSGVTLNKTNFTIDGLWRRVHPLPV